MTKAKTFGLILVGFLIGLGAGSVSGPTRLLKIVIANAPSKDDEAPVFSVGRKPFKVCSQVMYSDVLPVCTCMPEWIN